MKTKKTACVVVGAMGRMGQRICHLLSASDDYILAGATEGPQSNYPGKSLKDAMGLPGETAVIAEKLEDVKNSFDVIIDFTFPEISMKTASFASCEKKCAVIGSTGFSAEQMQELKKLSGQFPCVCAPNMSLGVNALFKLVQEAAAILKDGFDAEVLEIHHRHKKDAPSGTAARLAQILAETYGWDLAQAGVYQRRGFIGERKKQEIGIQTLRAGDVVGEHLVLFAGTGERLELIHRAQSRDCFAQGALYAAQWLQGRENGLYDMQDVLGLKGK